MDLDPLNIAIKCCLEPKKKKKKGALFLFIFLYVALEFAQDMKFSFSR